MILYILKIAILSAIFIFVIHNIIDYLKDTLTIPKKIDLVNVTEKKYDEIQKLLKKISSSSSSTSLHSSTDIQSLNASTISELLPPSVLNYKQNPYQEQQNLIGNIVQQPEPFSNSTFGEQTQFMKNELKNFIKQI